MTGTRTLLPIERPDDGLAIITLTGALDQAAATAVYDTLDLLDTEDRRVVALDLTRAWGTEPAAIRALHRHEDRQRAGGGGLYLIGPPTGLAEMLRTRAFRDRESWERFGGLRLTSKPHPTRYTPDGRVLADAEVFYGVPLVEIGEDGEIVLALGHHEPRRFYAALCAFSRRNGCDPADYLLDRVEDLAAFAAKAKGWHVIYTHATRETLGNTLPGDDPTWCVCDEGDGWYADQVTEGTQHAVPTMTYAIGA